MTVTFPLFKLESSLEDGFCQWERAAPAGRRGDRGTAGAALDRETETRDDYSMRFGSLIAPGEIPRRGDSGPAVREIQEWLCLHDFGLVIDGQFGPATERQLKAFQARAYTPAEELGRAGPRTIASLQAPVHRAFGRPPALNSGPKFYTAIETIALQHLAERPREVGGPNMGPWVRAYMRGKEGPAWPWCLGAVRAIVEAAAAVSSVDVSWIPETYSCDVLATAAGTRLYPGAEVARYLTDEDRRQAERVGLKYHRLPVAGIFLVRAAPNDWTHAGVVIDAEWGGSSWLFHTIEGNSNTEGSRDGYEMVRRIRRAKSSLDYIPLAVF